MKKIIASLSVALAVCASGFYFAVVKPALAGVSCSLPFTLTNGTIADASQVMANYNALVTCLTNAAAAGANNDITSLSALTTPITPGQGGSNVYIAQNPVATTGPDTAKNLVISGLLPTGYANVTGQSVIFVSPFTNISTVQAIVNGQATKQVFKQSAAGPIALTGGEIVTNQAFQAIFDGTQFEINPFPTVTAGWGIASAPTAISINTKNPPYGFGPCVNMTISATVGSNLLGLQLFAADTGLAPTSTHPILCNFRDATITSGDPLWVSLESAQYIDTNAAGATLGTINGLPFRIWVVLFYNGGTPKIGLWQSTQFTPGQTAGGAVVNMFQLMESQLQSPTAISGGATSAGTFYVGNGLSISNSAYRILGYLDFNSGLTTAGSYTSAPTRIQLFGPGIKKPGDTIYLTKTALATGQTGSATYTPSGTGPGVTNGTTVTSVTVTPQNAMDIVRVWGKETVINTSNANSGGFLMNGGTTVDYSGTQSGTVNNSSPGTVELGFTGIVTGTSATFTMFATGTAASNCVNATIVGAACVGIPGATSWLTLEEVQP